MYAAGTFDADDSSTGSYNNPGPSTSYDSD